MTKLKLHWQILIALALAVPAGLLVGEDGRTLGIPVLPVYRFLGTAFLDALKMLIVPLIMSAIITGIAGVGGTKGLGRLGGKTVLYYLMTSLLAILVGLTLVNITQPGYADGQPARDALGLEVDKEVVAEQVGTPAGGDFAQVFLRMIPPNVVEAAAEGQMLGLIFFSLLFGYFMTRLKGADDHPLKRFWEGVFDVMLMITHLVMRFAPLGVFALVARQVAEAGLQVFGPLAVFFVTVLGALAIHLLVTLPLLLRFLARVNPVRHFRVMLPALLTAFSTSSSSATLPVTLECVKEGGVSDRTSSFVLPLGATVNMDGTALYECVAAMFIAQAYGLDLSLGVQFTIVFTALLTSVGVAGVPSASLVAIAVILGAIGLPLEGVGLILAVDRPLDMLRTAMNVFSDSCGTMVIARSEGETDLLVDRPAEAEARAG